MIGGGGERGDGVGEYDMRDTLIRDNEHCDDVLHTCYMLFCLLEIHQGLAGLLVRWWMLRQQCFHRSCARFEHTRIYY